MSNLSKFQPTARDRVFEYETFDVMYLDLARKFLTGMDGMLIDATKTHIVKSAGVTVEIAQPIPTMDFRIFGYKPTRWERFGRRYLDQKFFSWLDKLNPSIATAQSGYEFNVGEDHNHGNCVLGMSFTKLGRNGQPEITIQSRTAYLMPTSVLELTLCGLVAEHYKSRFGKQVRLRWQVAQLQFSAMWGFPWLAGNWEAVCDLFESGEVLHRHKVNVDRYNRVYHEQTVDGKLSAYRRQNRMIQRTAEIRTGNYTPFIPTSWPIERLAHPFDLATIRPEDELEDAADPDERTEDDE